MRRLERSRISLAVWAAIGIGGLALALFLGFFGTGPVGGNPYQLKALFRSESQVKPRAQVRIAGVAVGEVASVQPAAEGSDAIEVTMNLEDAALPVRADAQATIKSRLVFEGNYYVALDPGSPGAPEMEEGDTIAVDRTTGPVQLDRVLSDLPIATRNNLRTVVQGVGRSLNEKDSNGETTGEALNDSLENTPAVFEGIAKTFDGLQGEKEGDVAKLVRGADATFAGFANQEAALADLISNFNRTMQATASRHDELSRTIELLDPVLRHQEEAFYELERAVPNTTALANDLIPGLEELPGTIRAVTPWLGQATPLLSAKEAGGLLNEARPTVRAGASLFADLIPILQDLEGISTCWSKNIFPTGDVVINDPPLPSGPTVEQELFQGFTGLASATQNFDGNGHFARAQIAGGAHLVETANMPGFGISRANAVLPPLGTRPAYTNSEPPINFESKCTANARPDLNAAATGGTP